MGGRLSVFDRSQLEAGSLVAAPALLGALLVSRSVEGSQITLRIVEVEAYNGTDDPASHAWRGRTARNSVMLGPPGHAYVYFTYGMHFCLNVVCGLEGDATAVLLRAATVTTGLDEVRLRRPGLPDRDLARGPARLCRALEVDRRVNGADLCSGAGQLSLETGQPVPTRTIRTGPRVGISRAAERPWRFWIDGESAVSAYRRAKSVVL